jgi:WD40 repeat protein
MLRYGVLYCVALCCAVRWCVMVRCLMLRCAMLRSVAFITSFQYRTSNLSYHHFKQGLHLVTASGDDKNPVLKLWDLRSSTSLPLATLQGHTEGILSVSWCPNDASLLMSCGKDNKTLMWDLMHLKVKLRLLHRFGSDVLALDHS